MILDGKRVLVTGATGSLGRATMLLAKKYNWNTEFIAFTRDESKQSNLKGQFPDCTFILGDVAKFTDVDRVVRGVKPNIILHYAAYKQVPSSQNNVWATIETNVIGSQNIVDAALINEVELVTASSSDKSCLVENSYGASKKLMECLFQDANKWKSTKFNISRYGNVICSHGSVLPLFMKQKERGGPLTVTMKEMTRFWIDLQEAVNLILVSLEQKPGVIVVPKALSMSMEDLAKYVIGEDPIDVVDIGIRSGEKIAESMVSLTESFYTEEDEGHYFINPPYTTPINQIPFTYTSDNPVGWLTYDQLTEKIRVSKELGS